MPPVPDARQQKLRDAVAEFSRATAFPVAFGGYEDRGITEVTALSGTEGSRLAGLRVVSSRGLGGKAMMEHRPRFTGDYMSSRQISHDYDAEIGSEHIVMLVAVPVVVDGDTRAVLYGGTRGGSAPKSSFMRAAAGVTSEFAQELRRIEADSTDREAVPSPLIPGALLEELRRSYAELRRIAADTNDPVTRERLSALESRLVHFGAEPSQPSVALTSRETDVLSQAALGRTNAGIGAALGIAESTAKGYLKAAMSKLDASTRQAAVASARRSGLIP